MSSNQTNQTNEMLASTFVANVRPAVAITQLDLDRCALGLDDNAWLEFAERVSDIDPVLGEVQRVHAQAADWNSPPVSEWPRLALAESWQLDRVDVTTVEDARLWWVSRYGDRTDGLSEL